MKKTKTISLLVDKKIGEDFIRFAKDSGEDSEILLNEILKNATKDRKGFSKYSNFEEVETTEEEKKIIAKFEKELENGTLETFSAEEIYDLVGYTPKNV